MKKIGLFCRALVKADIRNCFLGAHHSNSHYSTSSNILRLSPSCLKRLREIDPSTGLLRVLVDSGGCSGFQYKFEITPAPTSNDIVIEKEGVRVLVDENSVDLLEGSTLDYEEELIRAGFRITKNPQAEKGCSCGVSFTTKLD